MSSSRIAARVQRIKPSPSSAAQDRANELRRQGRDIVNLVVGEPDFDTPEHIRRAACEAIERGETRYTMSAGTPALRQAVCNKLLRENGLSYQPRDIVVTCGAKHAIFNALSVTLEPGHEVIIPAPYWVSYPDMTLACDGTPVVVTCQEEDGFRLQAAAFEAAITPNTRWLLLNSPTNPTGAAYGAADLRAIADVLLRHPQVMLMTDDIYEHIRFSDEASPHILAIEPSLRDRTMVINGVSKTYAMTGWRIGYAAGPADLISAMETLQSQSTSNACSVSQAAALAALEGDQSFISNMCVEFKKRHDYVVAELNSIEGVECLETDGTFYVFPNIEKLIARLDGINNDLEFSDYLIEKAGVALVPGSAFGTEGHIRISIATSMANLENALARIKQAI